MLKKEKIKLILYIALTVILISVAVILSITTRVKPILIRENQNPNHTQRELLDVIDHKH